MVLWSLVMSDISTNLVHLHKFKHLSLYEFTLHLFRIMFINLHNTITVRQIYETILTLKLCF